MPPRVMLTPIASLGWKDLAGLYVLRIERFSDTLPDRARPRLPAGGDCPEKVLRSRSVEQLRHPRFLYGRRVALTPAGIACR